MVVHVVLFRPKPQLPEEEAAALLRAFSRALKEIPSIARSRVGERVTHGRPGYEQMMDEDYRYIAMLEFADMNGLEAYLQHPAHEELATRFFGAFETALMYDYEIE
jgi:hypothetical protein